MAANTHIISGIIERHVEFYTFTAIHLEIQIVLVISILMKTNYGFIVQFGKNKPINTDFRKTSEATRDYFCTILLMVSNGCPLFYFFQITIGRLFFSCFFLVGSCSASLKSEETTLGVIRIMKEMIFELPQ